MAAAKPTTTVTGALGYSGKYITRRLIDAGHTVRTLTSSPDRPNPFADKLDIRPYRFDDPAALADSLRGTSTLINTYWVRFDHPPHFTFAQAVANTKALFTAAKAAGVRRIVHTSITNPSLDSPLPYFKGKAELERALEGTGLPHTILRPAVLFGHEDILVNNIAWALRRFPVFGVFADGAYKLQPIHVDDFAALAVDEATRTRNATIDAIGPETFTYRALVKAIADTLGLTRPIIPVHPTLAHAIAWAAGKLVGDVIITRDEIRGLMRGLLATDSTPPPQANTRLTQWARDNRDTLGRQYASELARRKDRAAPYESL